MIMSPDSSRADHRRRLHHDERLAATPATASPRSIRRPAPTLPFTANGLIRNAGANAAITSLSTDGDSLYGTGYVFGAGGNLEGIARVDWSDGTNIVWVEDCHGDTYGSFPKGDVVYAVQPRALLRQPARRLPADRPVDPCTTAPPSPRPSPAR